MLWSSYDSWGCPPQCSIQPIASLTRKVQKLKLHNLIEHIGAYTVHRAIKLFEPI